MRPTRGLFTLRRIMASILFIALMMTIVVQQIQLRGLAVREEQLRAAMAEAESKQAWIGAIREWESLGNSPAVNEQWARGSRRASARSTGP